MYTQHEEAKHDNAQASFHVQAEETLPFEVTA